MTQSQELAKVLEYYFSALDLFYHVFFKLRPGTDWHFSAFSARYALTNLQKYHLHGLKKHTVA